MRKFPRAIGAGLLACCLCATSAHANVLIAGTRVVFPAKDGEVTVRLTNDNAVPMLIEAWIDRGDPHSTPDIVDVPFLMTPPLFRMEAKKEQSLRIVYTQEPLPADRESLFWLNVLEVPPKPKGAAAEGQNYLQFSLRSRIKLFFRPDNLAGGALKAPAEVTWKSVTGDKGFALEAHNPTPYYVNITDLTLTLAGTAQPVPASLTVAPMSDARVPLVGLTQRPAAGTPVRFTIINDYGAAADFNSTIAP